MTTMFLDKETDALIKELAEAKTWPTRFEGLLDQGKTAQSEIAEADGKIADLEVRAKAAMKKLGCVNPQTRAVFHGMADMLISWQAFKDNL